MRLNIWGKGQKEILKTYERKDYDINYGTVEDMMNIVDEAGGETATEESLRRATMNHRAEFNELMMDIFPGLTEEELRTVKFKDILPVFLELIAYAQAEFGSASKN